MDINHIAQRTKIAVLKTGAWRATRLNKGESQKVNEEHHTDKAAKVSVKLTNHPALEALRKVHEEAYKSHCKLTLPSVQDGMRMLPVGREFEHSEKMNVFSGKHNEATSWFLGDYDIERESAPARLNGLYVASQWPVREKLAEKFSFSVRYLTAPMDGPWKEWLKESAQAAEDELRDMLRAAIQHVHDRCKADGKLYQSVFGKLSDLCALVPDLNLRDAPDIAAAAVAARQFAGANAEGIRDSKAVRNDIAQRAAAILAAFGGKPL